MRRLLLAAMMFGAASGAQAADMPDLPILRGAFTDGLNTTRVNWDGWYAGGQVGYSSASIDFTKSVTGLTNFIFRNSVLLDPTSQWTLLNTTAPQAMGFGAFVGRNYQWDDIVLGVEANYSYLNGLAASSTSSISRAIVNPTGDTPPAGHTHTYNVTLAGNAALQIKDAITLRGRAGWAADNFLPYAFLGLALGRMDVARSVTSSGTLQDDYDVTTTTVIGGVAINNTVHHTDFSPLATLGKKEERTNSFVFGWTGGIGLEYRLWGNVFLRGEWEYISYLTVKDTAVTMSSAHAGLGYKF
jgi:outer membrane immunogenic protein